jgi:mRNA-degrading endonuclease RelE of RelBE toxin-antitoxin system
VRAEVQWSSQVRNFISSLAPESKRKLRAGLRALAEDRGDIKSLVDELTGYSRLRVGEFRVIYRDAFEHGVPVRKCLFAERRDVVYEIFRKMVLDDIRN